MAAKIVSEKILSRRFTMGLSYLTSAIVNFYPYAGSYDNYIVVWDEFKRFRDFLREHCSSVCPDPDHKVKRS